MTTPPQPPAPASDQPSSLEPAGPDERTILTVFIAMAVFTLLVASIILFLVAGDTKPAENLPDFAAPGNEPWHLRGK